MSTLEEAIQKFEESDKTDHAGNSFRSELAQGDNIKFWNLRTDQNPATVGNNLSRDGLSFHHVYHPKGQWFQNVIKKIFIKAIDVGHNLWLKKYDKDAFVYDDVRLKSLDEFIKQFVAENISEGKGHKDILILKASDVVLGMMKEDIYWRVLVFDFINRFCGKEVFILEPCELENKKKWH